MEKLVWITFTIRLLLLSMLGQTRLAVTQCTSSSYTIITPGLETTIPDVTVACQGVPYLPQYEVDNSNRKYFRLKSGTKIALFLTTTSAITDVNTQNYYEIILEVNGVATISRNGLAGESGTSPAGNLLDSGSFAELYVSIVADGTIHVGTKDGGDIVSWKDADSDRINQDSINYILVQKFDDSLGEDAVFEFCDGAIKLLSQNQAEAKTVVTTQKRTQSPADANHAIDGLGTAGSYDADVCQQTANVNIDDFTWWKIDLLDMYDIKAVTMVNAHPTGLVCPKGWRFFGYACYYHGTDSVTWAAAQADCDSKDGNLVAIRTEEIRDFLVGWLPEDATVDYWIGLNDADNDNGLLWTAEVQDSSVSNDWSTGSNYYDDFGSSQPTSGDGNLCMFMEGSNSLLWNDADCTTNKRYICQKDLCPANYVLFGVRCYRLYGANTWTSAQSTCSGDLITIDSDIVQGYVNDWLDNAITDYWIGLNDVNSEGTYVWDSGIGSGYTNWDGPQPDGNGDCVVMQYAEANWDDRLCTESYGYICERRPTVSPRPQLQTTEVRVGSCDIVSGTASVQLTEIKQNEVCQTPVTEDEVQEDRVGFSLFRECDANYYGQYVWLLKENTGASNVWFSTCEVEVWGQDIADADKPRVRFTQQTVSDLEKNLADNSPLSFYVQKSQGSAANPTCCELSLEPLTPLTNEASEGAAANAETADFTYSFDTTLSTAAESFDFMFTPTDTADKEFQITVHDDFCPAEDEQFGFKFSHLTPGLLAGDATASTYATITYTIENDDVTYCWEDITLSVKENTGVVTAVLVRTGNLDATTTALIKTVPGSAMDGIDYEGIVLGSTEGQIVFDSSDPDQQRISIELTIMEDTDCETTTAHDEMFTLVIDSTTEGKICEDSTSTTLDTVTITIEHDDEKFAFQQTTHTVSETKRQVEVVVELVDGPLDRDVMIDVKSQPKEPPSATPELDYLSVDIDTTLTIPAGRTSESLTVTVTNDKLVEDDMETFELILVRNPTTLPTCVLDSTKDKTDIHIEDNDCCWSVEPTTLTVSEIDEDSPEITVKCERLPGSVLKPTFPITANLQIGTTGISGDRKASSETDYSVLGTAVVIDAGTTSKISRPFTIKDDILEEATEYFEVTVSADDGELCGPLTTTVEIEDNDVTVHLSSCGDDSSVLEGNKQLTVTLTRTGDLSSSDLVLLLTKPVTAQPDTGSGDGDYGSINVLKTFPALESTITHDIIINDDILEENDKTFIVQVEKQGVETYVNTTLDRCTVTIIDDDCTFFISIPENSRMVTEGNGVTVTLTISRLGYLKRPANVYIEASSVNGDSPSDATSGQDYAPLSRLVIFRPDDSSETVTLTISDDNIPEIVEYLQVSLSSGDCGIDGDDTVVIGIEDDDEVVIWMRDDEMTVNEDVGEACPVLYRSGPLDRVDVVTLSVTSLGSDVSSAATPGADFDDSDVTITFEQNEDEKSACVPVHNDNFEEQGLDSFLVRIRGSEHRQARQAPSALQARIDNDKRETIVYIRDDDGSFQLSCPSPRISESVGSVTCTVVRTGPATNSEIAYVSTSDGEATSPADYEPLSGESLMFGQTVKSMSFSVKIYGDSELEGSEDFFVYLAADSGGTDLGQRAQIITILDDDNSVRFVPTFGIPSTENSVTVSESAGTVRLTIQRSAYGFDRPSGTTSVRVSSREINPGDANTATPADGNNVDYSNINTQVNFQIGQTRQDIVIEIHDDEVGESQEAFEIVLSDPVPEENNFVVYPSLMTVYINDDDGGEDPEEEEEEEEEESGGDGGNTLSEAYIIAIGGGVGLLILVGVLGLIGFVVFARLGQAPAPTPRPYPPALIRAPSRPPPYYPSNQPRIEFGRQPQGPRPIRYT